MLLIFIYIIAGLKVDDTASKTDKQLFRRKSILQYIYMYMHIKVSQNDPNLNTWLAIQCQPCLSNFQCSVSHKSNSNYQAHTLYRYGHGKQIY